MEYRHAVAKMQEVTDPAKKLFYFSVFFGAAQRMLNWEWDRDLALIHMVTQYAHTQISPTIQAPTLGLLPIDLAIIYEKLTQVASDLATYFEKTENDNNKKDLCQILGRFAEITYAISGNGSYLYEKESFKL
jgi:hypothetical protein